MKLNILLNLTMIALITPLLAQAQGRPIYPSDICSALYQKVTKISLDDGNLAIARTCESITSPLPTRNDNQAYSKLSVVSFSQPGLRLCLAIAKQDDSSMANPCLLAIANKNISVTDEKDCGQKQTPSEVVSCLSEVAR